ncbi:MAG: DJ-1/PfpI family protein, partial [Actinomycetota bacterium]|nr:DJ-1/PfpI family protein [Actinomycetota bacterium]
TGVTSRDVLAPLEVMRLTSFLSVRHVSPTGTTVPGFEPFHMFPVDGGIDEAINTDLLIVPGGLGSVTMTKDQQVTTWIRATARQSRFVMSISTGSLLLAAAGLMEDRDASGHWLAHDELEAMGARVSATAATRHGRIITTDGSVAAAEVAGTLPARLQFGPQPEPV